MKSDIKGTWDGPALSLAVTPVINTCAPQGLCSCCLTATPHPQSCQLRHILGVSAETLLSYRTLLGTAPRKSPFHDLVALRASKNIRVAVKEKSCNYFQDVLPHPRDTPSELGDTPSRPSAHWKNEQRQKQAVCRQ